MNPIRQKRSLLRLDRKGLSIIEVLTSIIVAMIGVFGIMVLIPFSIKQSQSGLDRDAATVAARNAFDVFGIRGFRAVADNLDLRWTTESGTVSVAAPEVICIDPLGVMEQGGFARSIFTPPLSPNPPFRFPFGFPTDTSGNPALPDAGTNAFPDAGDLKIRVANLLDPAGNQFSLAAARDMFRAEDDLVFGESITVAGSDGSLNGPTQVFDVGSSGINAQRQSGGRISWCAIAVPTKLDYSSAATGAGAFKYRFFILVFKDRKTDEIDTVDNDQVMLTANLDINANVGLQSPLNTVFFEAGVTLDGTIGKDDWVMLINRAETDTSVTGYPMGIEPAEVGFDKQIAFARVTNFSPGSGALLPSITLDGPDFNFGDLSDPDNIISPTRIVYLRNVIGVYERSMTLESASKWSISN